ncbi:MAG TPA: type II secretion system protein [Candidatus Paceibacterota bacterium]|nr:type II secretion system protein [Candidatus Paceibacterota bacterium]
MSRSKGFTLIELLVVIAIIGLLASIILASLNTARQKGRDARRIADVKEIQLALELYYDANTTYPPVTVTLSGTPSAANIPSLLAPTYISVIPTDPSQPASGNSAYYYQYESLATDGTTACTSGTCPNYVVIAHLEAGANSSTWSGSGTGIAAGICPASGGSTSPYPYCVHS